MTRHNHRQRIHQIIRARILRGEVGPQDRLVDTAIAAEAGVSRMPVREALMQLVSEGYLEGTTRGFALPSLSPGRITEIFLLRRLLEPHAAASAAQARSDVDLKAMSSALAETTATLENGDFETFYRASETLRNTWVGAVPNAELRAAVMRYSGQIQAVRLATMRDRHTHETVVAGQRELLNAFRMRDALAAEECTLRFVLDGERAYHRLASLEQAPLDHAPQRHPSPPAP